MPSHPNIRAAKPIKNTPIFILSGKVSSVFRIFAIKVLAKILTGPMAENWFPTARPKLIQVPRQYFGPKRACLKVILFCSESLEISYCLEATKSA